MKIYKLKFDLDEYDFFVYDTSYEEIRSFDGRTHLDTWIPKKVTRDNSKEEKILGDAPLFLIPAFSQRAVDCLYPLIHSHVEFLPLDFEEKYYGVNVITVLDALDHNNSTCRYFSDGKRIMAIEKYVFQPTIIGRTPIFKLSDERTRWCFASEELKLLVEESGLKGFNFELLWSDEI